MTKQNFFKAVGIDLPKALPEDPPASPDAKLWDEFRGGSDAAYVEIYETFFETLYSYGVRIVGEPTMVQDSIQEVFLDLREFRDKIGPTDAIKFYLFKCLKRKLIRGLKKWDGRIQKFDEKIDFEFSLSPEQLLIDQQMNQLQQERLKQALSQLTPRRKEIIYYFYFEGLSYPQIQEIMGLDSVKSARNLLYKSLGFLKEIFE